MPIEFRNPAAPDEFVATHDETSARALDDHVAREGIFGTVLLAFAHDTVDEGASVANDIDFDLSSCPCSERIGAVDRLVADSESGMLHVYSGDVPATRLLLVGINDSTVAAGGSNCPATKQFHATEHPVDRRASV